MKTRQIVVGLCLLLGFTTAYAQEGDNSRLKNLTLSGYIQGEYQYGGKSASLLVGKGNTDPDKSFSRTGIRRGRIKLEYTENIASAVFQLDLTEKGLGIKDAHLKIKDPWLRTNSLQAGLFNSPFGYENSYSASSRESPERSAISQSLFPEEQDLGAMLVLQPAESSPLRFLKLEAGLFSGNGIRQETDSKRDFAGRLSASKSLTHGFSFTLGISLYNGFAYQGTENVYRMEGNTFVLHTNASNLGSFAKREYYGVDAQISFAGLLGKTKLQAEYLLGQQPGTPTGSKTPAYSLLSGYDTYIRNFRGGYAMLTHYIGKSPLAAVVKYDWYDPNTDVSGDNVGLNETTATDLARSTWGTGVLWDINKALRLQAYYEFKDNEKASAIAGMNENVDDDVFTLRLQYKF
ncbi:MAG: OprO/OprP family phosphate-selective porin [Tannerellaceae bacterium]|jgi:phosphate-selective porin|nr:OprO/OprP family phosphate-selective porin [Tannerellaceae bacterium]